MNLKENVVNMMAISLDANDDFTSSQVRTVINLLNGIMMDYECVPKKELPSAELINNDKIIKHFIASKRLSGCTKNTLKTYYYHINRFVDFININISDISTDSIRYYMAKINKSESYSNHIRLVLNTFLSFCEIEGYLDKNPCKKIEKIKVRRKMEKPYSDTEAEMLRKSCKSSREKALVDFLFSTGARREEVTKIKISDVDFSERSVLIHGKGNKDRLVYFSARCELSLKEYLKEKNRSDVYLFSSIKKPYDKINNNGLANIIKNIGKRANVDNVHLHRFRHWFGTYMANRGVPIQDLKEMMGHSKIETTNNYYVYVNNERIKIEHRQNAA